MSDNKLLAPLAGCELRPALLSLLDELERELRLLDLWQSSAPSAEALSSSAPFAVDTLTFVQWLQFIFLDKMRHLLACSLPLPAAISVLPMANEYFKGLAVNSANIEHLIGRIDSLITARVK